MLPRHEFRTIEEFVLWLEARCDTADATAIGEPAVTINQARQQGRRAAYEDVLVLVRTSNLGIVYPPSEDKS